MSNTSFYSPVPAITCDETWLDGNTGRFQSPFYPQFYPNGLDCEVRVLPFGEPGQVCFLEVRFDEFAVEASEVLDECANDDLEVSSDNPFTEPSR